MQNKGGKMEIKELYTMEQKSGVKIPLYSMSVPAGSPINIEEHIDEMIDINEYLIKHPAATFFAKIRGHNLKEIGIFDNDIVVFDTAIRPQDGKVVIAESNNELTIKIYRNINGTEYLQLSDSSFLPLRIEPYLQFDIIGVVTKVIHTL